MRIGALHVVLAAVGCPKFKVPDNMIVKNESKMSMEISCPTTDETWIVVCDGKSWVAGNASCPKGEAPKISKYFVGCSFPTGIR